MSSRRCTYMTILKLTSRHFKPKNAFSSQGETYEEVGELRTLETRQPIQSPRVESWLIDLRNEPIRLATDVCRSQISVCVARCGADSQRQTYTGSHRLTAVIGWGYLSLRLKSKTWSYTSCIETIFIYYSLRIRIKKINPQLIARLLPQTITIGPTYLSPNMNSFWLRPDLSPRA